jgi:4-amino-4-deoxy-L-arabinose transferase-like glycosyltransferase
MEDREHGATIKRQSAKWAGGTKDLGLLVALLLSAGAIRGWLVTHTEVTARDGVGFIRYAWQLKYQPWEQVLRNNPHPPLYPLTILAVSYPIRHLLSGPDSFTMQISAQLANGLAGLLLVIPMFYIGKNLFGRRVGFLSAALFQCLPASSRVLSDALSEGLFLFLAAVSLLCAIKAFKHMSRLRFALCGVFGGLAYLTRPEGALIVAAAGLVILGIQVSAGWRRPWSKTFYCGGALAATALIIAVPYMIVIQHITNKTTGKNILQSPDSNFINLDHRSMRSSGLRQPTPRDWKISRADLVGVYWAQVKDSEMLGRLIFALKALFGEIVKAYHYVAWAGVLLGIGWFWGRWRQIPGAWVLLLLCVLHGLVLLRVAYFAGYVAERHALIIVMATMAWAIAGVLAIGPKLYSLLVRLPQVPTLALSHSRRGWRVASVVLALVLGATALPKTLEPLHVNRSGYHAAGLWLASHANPSDVIIDPFSWAEYYSGQVFRDGAGYQRQSDYQPNRYVVLGGSQNEHQRLPLICDAEVLAKQGTVVYQWPTHPLRVKAEPVVVYCIAPTGH